MVLTYVLQKIIFVIFYPNNRGQSIIFEFENSTRSKIFSKEIKLFEELEQSNVTWQKKAKVKF